MSDSYKNRQIATVQFLGDTIDFIADNERLQERVENVSHEKEVLRCLAKYTHSDDVFWDVGACMGIHTFVMAKQLSEGNVRAFEPMHTNRAICADNRAVNELDNVHIERTALANSSGTREFEVRQSLEAGYGRHSFANDSSKDYDYLLTYDVPVEKGDMLTDEQPNAVKIDVEGASPLVLQGMKDKLSSPACQIVIVETHEPNPVQPSHEDFGFTREDIVSFLEDCGFTVSTLENQFHLCGIKTDVSELSSELAEINPTVNLVQDDIANRAEDAIVNSAGTSLRMGSGVAGALRDEGGEELHRDAIKKGPIGLGEAVKTDGYGLQSDTVIHAASMPHYGDGKSTVTSITKSISQALSLAEEQNCSSIAIPAVGCGLGGVSLTSGLTAILETIVEYDYESVETISIVLYSDDEYHTAASLIE